MNDRLTDDEKNNLRINEILLILKQIDLDSIRASRSVSCALAFGNKPNPEDVDKLNSYELKAEALRKELRELKYNI